MTWNTEKEEEQIVHQQDTCTYLHCFFWNTSC